MEFINNRIAWLNCGFFHKKLFASQRRVNAVPGGSSGEGIQSARLYIHPGGGKLLTVSKVGYIYSGCLSRSSQNMLELLGVVWANCQNFENIWENCSIRWAFKQFCFEEIRKIDLLWEIVIHRASLLWMF
jgi:hypothetical protein